VELAEIEIGPLGPRMFSRPSSHVRSPAGVIGPVLDQRNGNWRHWNGNGVPRKGIEPSQACSKRSEGALSELEEAARKRHMTTYRATSYWPSVGPAPPSATIVRAAVGRVRAPSAVPGPRLRRAPAGDVHRQRDPRPVHIAAGGHRHLDRPCLVCRHPHRRAHLRHGHLPPQDLLVERRTGVLSCDSMLTHYPAVENMRARLALGARQGLLALAVALVARVQVQR
jgi:hypothetical protein